MQCGVWNQMKIWSSHLMDNLSNCLMNLKNSCDSTGFEPMTSAMPVQCSHQLSYEVTQWRAGQFVGLMFSRERNVYFIYSCSKRSSFALKRSNSWGFTCCMISGQNMDSSDFMLAFSLQHHIPHYEAVSRFKKIRGWMATLLTYVILRYLLFNSTTAQRRKYFLQVTFSCPFRT